MNNSRAGESKVTVDEQHGDEKRRDAERKVGQHRRHCLRTEALTDSVFCI